MLKNNNIQKSISFSISGSYIFYHIGVGKFLQENYKLDDVIFLGSSGGALIALLLAIKYPLNKLEDEIISILKKYSNYKTGIYFNCINNDIEILLNSIITDEMAINLDNLIIFNSVISYKIVKNNIKKFNSKKELISNVLASCHIPILLDKKIFYKIDDTRYLDGLLTEFQPILNTHTIKVYPYMFNKIWKYLWVFTALCFYSDSNYNKSVIAAGYDEAKYNLDHWKTL